MCEGPQLRASRACGRSIGPLRSTSSRHRDLCISPHHESADMLKFDVHARASAVTAGDIS